MTVLVAAVVVAVAGCMDASAWDNGIGGPGGGDGGGGGDDPRPPGGGGDQLVENECDGLDNDADGLVDEGCACELGATQECFTGPTLSIIDGEQCAYGSQTCEGQVEFAGWGPCVGDVLPVAEVCWDGLDNNCNGDVDEGCSCSPGETRWCYEGPEATRGVGIRQPGVEECIGEGMGWTPCEGQVLPAEEDCYNGVDDDCDGEIDEECEPPPAIPVGCSEATMTHVVGAADCGEDEAVFMMDDGDGPNFICCPLPASDILTDDPPQVRGAVCGANEVITGAVGRFNFKCSRVNTDRYRLASPRLPCYFGSGSSGAWGVSRCASHPHSFSVLHDRLFGSDGCSGQPYGALFVSQRGDDCRDLAAAQLQYTGAVPGDPAGGAVPMFID